MIVEIADLLSAQQLDGVRSVLAGCDYVDGSRSAGLVAGSVKRNQEARVEPSQLEALNNIVMTSLVKHPAYLHAALPLRIAAPIYARYLSGMEYGPHIDDPVMGTNPRYRSDVSITVFLSEPGDYLGGELCIESEYGEQRIKRAAGCAVLYPSSSRHSVRKVSGGERLVAVTWLQSMVRSAEQRRILYKLAQARDLLLQGGNPSAYAAVEESYTNLLRMWAET